jgi:hypothetical protein
MAEPVLQTGKRAAPCQQQEGPGPGVAFFLNSLRSNRLGWYTSRCLDAAGTGKGRLMRRAAEKPPFGCILARRDCVTSMGTARGLTHGAYMLFF